jgi:hypothetical protein
MTYVSPGNKAAKKELTASRIRVQMVALAGPVLALPGEKGVSCVRER